MKKKLTLIIVFSMISVFILNLRQPAIYISGESEVIDWHSYSGEKIV